MDSLDGLDQLPFRLRDVANTEAEPAFTSTAKSKLSYLPAELLSMIFTWLRRPQDLASLCLVSQHFYDVAMPELYRNMYLNVDTWDVEKLDNLLTKGHRGHPYIRDLEVDSDRLNSEDKALKTTKDILSLLHRDQLISFRCPLESGLDNDTLILLASTQRKLDSVALGPFHDSAFNNLMSCLLPWPTRLSTIRLPWKLLSNQDIKFYQQLIDRCHRRLRALTVRSHIMKSDPAPLHLRNMNDFTIGTARLVKDLFEHLEPYNGERKLELTDLNLQNQDLSGCENTWLKFVDFSKLQTLQIWNCDNADELLGHLLEINRQMGLNIHGLVLSCEEQEQIKFPQHVAEYVRATKGLKYLNVCHVLDTGGHMWHLDLQALQGHGATLKDLYVGLGSTTSAPHLLVPTADDFTWLVTTCPRLRQLAIPLPQISLKDAFQGHWGEYGDALAKLASLPRLKVLRILTWPQHHYKFHNRSFEVELRRRPYLEDLHTFTDSIARLFDQLRDDHADRISVIMFGNAEAKNTVRHYGSSHQTIVFDVPVTFKVRRFMSEFGFRTKVERLLPALMEEEEPIAYVVDEDTDQGLSLEAYTSY